jgi:Flp pilus assembly protein TadG
MISRPRPRDRRGVAAVEAAAVTMLFLCPLVIEVWEVGRMIYVQQIVANAAREGARLAGQATTIDSSGNVIQVTQSSGTVNVTNQVYQYLYAAGLTTLSTSDVTTTFAFDSGSSTEPYQGTKGQTFTVSVSVTWSRVRWVNLGVINPPTIQYTAHWQMLVDDPFTVNSSLPTW